jgi:hypothetical protein
MILDHTQSPAPYNDPVWLAKDRAKRAIDGAAYVAKQALERKPGDAAAALRSAAAGLLIRAADYDATPPVVCPDCHDSDLVHRLAWVDARTREFAEFIDPSDPDGTDVDYPMYCGRCCRSVAP